MASGNFLIGDNISIEQFNNDIIPLLEEKGYSVNDKIKTNYDDRQLVKNPTLISIKGQGDLEKGINSTLIEFGEKRSKEERERGLKNNEIHSYQVYTFSHHEGTGKKQKSIHIGNFKTIGVYSKDETASELFSAIAQKYMIKEAENKAISAMKQIRRMLNTKVKDI
ncbi:hypothetical protein KY314_03915 [Candidatus Woesearchaeota archaeon]|nr:hypothetical protein [Candidatus Woesearchaeota archaeon]